MKVPQFLPIFMKLCQNYHLLHDMLLLTKFHEDIAKIVKVLLKWNQNKYTRVDRKFLTGAYLRNDKFFVHQLDCRVYLF